MSGKSKKQSGPRRHRKLDNTRKAAGLYYYVREGRPVAGYETLEQIATAFGKLPATIEDKYEELRTSGEGITKLKLYALVALGYKRSKYDRGEDATNMQKALAEMHVYRSRKRQGLDVTGMRPIDITRRHLNPDGPTTAQNLKTLLMKKYREIRQGTKPYHTLLRRDLDQRRDALEAQIAQQGTASAAGGGGGGVGSGGRGSNKKRRYKAVGNGGGGGGGASSGHGNKAAATDEVPTVVTAYPRDPRGPNGNLVDIKKGAPSDKSKAKKAAAQAAFDRDISAYIDNDAAAADAGATVGAAAAAAASAAAGAGAVAGAEINDAEFDELQDTDRWFRHGVDDDDDELPDLVAYDGLGGVAWQSPRDDDDDDDGDDDDKFGGMAWQSPRDETD
ncbi:hypothetical protein OAM67_00315 [bacterium]|nr:hypothetical protein [bacterium]